MKKRQIFIQKKLSVKKLLSLQQQRQQQQQQQQQLKKVLNSFVATFWSNKERTMCSRNLVRKKTKKIIVHCLRLRQSHNFRQQQFLSYNSLMKKGKFIFI